MSDPKAFRPAPRDRRMFADRMFASRSARHNPPTLSVVVPRVPHLFIAKTAVFPQYLAQVAALTRTAIAQ